MDIGANKQELYSPLISIIVPITRMFGKLGDLETWLAEIDFQTTEIILVHDLQDNLTSEQLQTISSKYPMLRLIEKTFYSAGLARNAGVEISQGQWIVFWDSDDKPHVSVLNDFMSNLNKNAYEVYVFDFKIESDGEVRDVKTRNWRDIAFQPGIWRMIFSKSAVANILFPSFSLGEDQFFLGQMNLPNRRISYLDTCIYTYRSGVDGQATSQKSNLLTVQESLQVLSSLRKNQSGEDAEFTSILFWRQILTLLKRGNVNLKLRAMLVSVESSLKPNRNYLRSTRALLYVLSMVLARNA